MFYVCFNHKKTNTVEVQCYFSAVTTLRYTAAGKNMQWNAFFLQVIQE